MNSKHLQILRTIDKVDRIGIGGVIELLQKPESEFGANLNPIQAALIGQFLACKGKDNRETIDNMRRWFLTVQQAKDGSAAAGDQND